ncbi:F0F1 ATP synthase subunit B [Ileibacterium valens]|uniref:F0F1 ATP synthase subunit B n=1 Tax=Ileibacterium valens TaxID=1862668 RepID=UPI00272C8715|nr:F0F1 ATP synthase subunit B [Ileibacterium valens]
MINFTIENYLRISWQDVILVCISSLIIVLVCRKYFWSKLLTFIEKRQQLIQNNINDSERLKKEALEVKDQYDAKMRGAAEQASSIIDNAREQATLEKQQIIDAAQKQASHIEKSAHEEVEREKLEAQTQMRQAITEVAMAAAGQILSQELDEERQKKIIDDFIDSDGLGV